MYHDVDRDVGRSRSEFERQLSVFKKHFQLVSLCELMDRRTNGTLSGYEIVLTFDDGTQNHFSAAYPALQRYAAPATFFVCPMLMETGRWVWTMELRARLRVISPQGHQRLASEFGRASTQPNDFVEWAKTLGLREREYFEDVVRRGSPEWRPTSRENDVCAPLTWSQLSSMDPALITVGSHTLTHPILSVIRPEEAETEIAQSRVMLEAKLQRSVEYFCYPNGSHNPAVAEFARQHYRASVTTRAGMVTDDALDYLLPRVSAGTNNDLSTFLWRLHRP